MAEKTYNLKKLHKELEDAGIPIHGCAADGRIDFKDEATKEQKTQAQVILDAHVPTWYVEERIKEYPAISEQLDMLYWDQVNGTTIWKDKIASIKAKYPKE